MNSSAEPSEQGKKRILVVGGVPESLLNFRRELLESLRATGYDVFAATSLETIFDRSMTLEKIKRELGDIGVRFIPLRLRRTSRNPINDLCLVFSLAATVLRIRPDIILSYTLKPVLYSSFLRWLFPRLKVVSMLTGINLLSEVMDSRHLFFSILRWVVRVVLRKSSLIVVQNEADKQWVITECRICPERVRVTEGSGVNVSYFVQQPVPVEPFTYLLMGRFIKEKGITEFCEAAKIVRTAYPKTYFHLVGAFESRPGAYTRENLASLIAQSGVVQFEPVADVREHLRRASVCVLPALTREGMSRSLLEALATGRPIVTTDVPGCRETVIHGVNGYIVPPGDYKSLAKAMLTLREDPSVLADMGKNSRELAEKRFNVDSVIAALRSYIDELRSA